MENQKELSGQKLDMAKNRLNEAELTPLVNTLEQMLEQIDGIVRCLTEQQYDFGKKLRQIDILISQGNGILIDDEDSKLEHLNSLTKLAERTMVEADKLAETLTKETEEKAEAEAAKIIAEAEGKAKTEADGIIAEARQRAKEAATEETQNILGGITEIRDVFEKAYEKVLSNLGNPEEAESPAD